jgi:dihydrofolate synthase/folylpolyglutamate synthase
LLQRQPTVIADTAHNKPGIQALLETILTMPHDRLRMVVGFVRDKDVSSVLAMMPFEAIYYFCQAQSPRSLAVGELVTQAGLAGLIGQGYPDVNEALSAALTDSGPEDLILITGSTYVVAEVNSL